MSPLRLLPAAALLLAAGASLARGEEPKRFFQMSRREISATLKTIHARNPTLQSRIEAVSSLFLGTPYRLGPLGEGPEGEFDRDPLISFEAVDCTTLVEQTMALSLAPTLEEALTLLQGIRYQYGRISYKTRNHFPEVDWLPNNVEAGYLKDITTEVAGAATRRAAKRISKRDWYSQRTLEDIQGFKAFPAAEKEARLERLRKLGGEFPDRIASIPYLPMELLPQVLDKIPSGTIANLVREDRPDKPVLVSHQVLIIAMDGSRRVRHASSRGRVEDVPALEYFHRYSNSPWPLLGLNLDQVNERRKRP